MGKRCPSHLYDFIQQKSPFPLLLHLACCLLSSRIGPQAARPAPGGQTDVRMSAGPEEGGSGEAESGCATS